MIRGATEDDLGYFIAAARSYAEVIGLDFDEDVFTESFYSLLEAENIFFFVIPNRAHCVIMLTPSLFGNDLVAKVISTWGRGGVDCFRAARKFAKSRGATKIMADANLSQRLVKFYKRVGMKKFDTNFMGDL